MFIYTVPFTAWVRNESKKDSAGHIIQWAELENFWVQVENTVYRHDGAFGLFDHQAH